MFSIKFLKEFVNISSLINELLNFQRPGPGLKRLLLEIVTKTDKWLVLKAGIMSVSLENYWSLFDRNIKSSLQLRVELRY